jgi:nucleoid-associated protein EbfC
MSDAMPDLSSLLGQAMAMQQQIADAQAAAAEAEVEGRSGGGAVTVTFTGAGEPTGITIAASVVDPNDVEMLEDLVLAAMRDGLAKVTELQQESMSAAMGGGIGGLDLGALGLGELGLGGPPELGR